MEEGAEQGTVWWAGGDEPFLEDGESMGTVAAQKAETELWTEGWGSCAASAGTTSHSCLQQLLHWAESICETPQPLEIIPQSL